MVSLLKAALRILAWTSILPALAFLLLLRLVFPRRPGTVPSSIERLTLVVPYEPTGRSGGSMAIAQLIETLGRQYQIRIVPLWSMAPAGGWKATLSAYLLSSVPVPAHCTQFLLAPGAVKRRLAPHDPVIIEFTAGALFTFFGAPRSYTILRNHEMLLRRVLSEHALRSGEWRVLSFLRLAATYLFTYRICLGVDHVVALTREDGADLIRFFPRLAGRVTVIPVSFDVPSTPPAEPLAEASRDVLFLANFYHRPNRDGLVWFLREAAPHLHSGITLHLCGLDEPLNEMALHSPNVRIVRHGFVKDVAAAFPRVTVAVSPLVSGAGVRIKNLFLAGERKAIVTTVLGNHGIDFEPGQSAEVCTTGEQMAQRLEGLLDNPTRAAAIANAGYDHVKQRFTAEAMLGRYEDLFARAQAPPPILVGDLPRDHRGARAPHA